MLGKVSNASAFNAPDHLLYPIVLAGTILEWSDYLKTREDIVKKSVLSVVVAFFMVGGAKAELSEKSSLQDLYNFQNEILKVVQVQGAPMKESKPQQWRIGEALNFDVKVKGIKVGKVSYKFEAETQTNAIVTQTVDMFKKHVEVDLYYNKYNGVLSSVRYGSADIPLPSPKDEVLTEGQEQAVVDAGIFSTKYIKTSDDKKLKKEIWISEELPLKGWVRLKTVYEKVDVTLELRSYAKIK
jgi:hypothetical protein